VNLCNKVFVRVSHRFACACVCIFLCRAFACVLRFSVGVFLVLVACSCYVVPVLTLFEVLRVLSGHRLFDFRDRICGCHSPPLWSPVRPFNWYQSRLMIIPPETVLDARRRQWIEVQENHRFSMGWITRFGRFG